MNELIPLEWFLSDREDFRMTHYAEVMGYLVTCGDDKTHLQYYLGPYMIYFSYRKGTWGVCYTDKLDVKYTCDKAFPHLQDALEYVLKCYNTDKEFCISSVIRIPDETTFNLKFYTMDEYFNFTNEVFKLTEIVDLTIKSLKK